MVHKDKRKREREEICYVGILWNGALEKGKKKEGLIETLKRRLKNKVTKEKYLFVSSHKRLQYAMDIIQKGKIKKSSLKKINIIPLFQKSFLSESFRRIELLPILVVYTLQVLLQLDGLAKRTPLSDLSHKTVTRKVRESLRRVLNNKKDLTVECRALRKNGIWIGYGSYKGVGFHWFVINGPSIASHMSGSSPPPLAGLSDQGI
ncbi:MAG: hypothetical protein KAW16_07270 [candidate division Zixibacteria bacterium]|nr:hypothetical protein [candidate division Zixibacteria bacterium]